MQEKREFLRLFIQLLLSLAVGFVLSFAFAPTNYGAIAWFYPAALLTLIWTTPRKSPKADFWKGFLIAYLSGVGFWLKGVSFIGAVSQQGGWASSGGLALYLSLFFGLYGGWANTLGRPQPLPKKKCQPAWMILKVAFLHGACWCFLEWLRGIGRLSFGWDGLGVSFLDSGFVLAQTADLIGVTGLSFIPVFGGAVLIQTLTAFHNEALYGYRRVHWEVALTMSLLCLSFTYGTFRLKGLHEVESKPLRALLLQQNIPLSFSWDPELSYKIYEDFQAEMEEAFHTIEERTMRQLEETGSATLSHPDLVIWPESALPGPIWMSPDASLALDQENAYLFDEIVRPWGDFLFITGVNQFPLKVNEEGVPEIDEKGPYYNAIGFFPDQFESYAMRPKNHLMPFGEYMPLESFSLFQLAYKYSAGQTFGGSFTPASTFIPYSVTRDGFSFSIIPTVCYEDTVSVLVKKYLKHEPQMIVNVTNDGWFSGTDCAEKHFQNARFRSIEFRRPLARSANTGVTGVVNITGFTVHSPTKKLQEFRDASGNAEIKGSLEAVVDIPLKPIMTVYSSVGNLFSWGGGILVAFSSVFSIVKRRGLNHVE